LASAVVALASAFFGWRNSSKATNVNMGAQQLQWVQQAMTEATAAKTDARQAKDDAAAAEVSAKAATRSAAAATDRADDAERRLSSVIVSMESLIRWAEAVVSAAQDADVPSDEVRAIVNGGPPGFTQAKLALDRRRAG
jgi:hypothetical protein